MKYSKAMVATSVLALLLPLLSACAGSPAAFIANAEAASAQNGSTCPRPLVIWPATGDNEDAYLLDLGRQFQQQSGVGLELLDMPFDDILRKYVTAVPSGKGPDILLGPSDWTGLLGEGGYVVDLTGKYDTGRFLENTVEAATYQGQLWGVPKSFEVVAQYYNADLLEQPAESFDTLKQLSPGLAGGNYALAYDITNFYFSAPFLYAVGGELFDENGEFVLTEEAATAWLTELRDLQNEAALPREVTSESANALFRGDNSATFFSGPWEVEGFRELGFNWKVANLPAVNGQPARPFLGTKVMFISSTSPCQQAALDFIEFSTQPEQEVAWVRDVNAAYLPAARAPYEDPVLAESEAVQSFLQQAETSVPFPNAPGVGQIWTPGLDALTAVLNQGADPATAARQMVETIRENLEVRE
jgi:arabinogalactan oligomer/maltooligosaccharide transport system substrate-binding protein